MRHVILMPDRESGGFVVEVPCLPGCYSQGETEEEAIANIREAIELHIASMIAHGEEVPEDVELILATASCRTARKLKARHLMRRWRLQVTPTGRTLI